MWKNRIVPLALAAALLLLLGGCTLGGVDPEFAGMWGKTDSGETVTWEFTRFAASVEVSGTSTGRAEFLLETYDQDADRIRMQVRSVAGAYGGAFRPGDTYYCTYSISGNDLYLLLSTTGYPSSATAGPYTKL